MAWKVTAMCSLRGLPLPPIWESSQARRTWKGDAPNRTTSALLWQKKLIFLICRAHASAFARCIRFSSATVRSRHQRRIIRFSHPTAWCASKAWCCRHNPIESVRGRHGQFPSNNRAARRSSTKEGSGTGPMCLRVPRLSVPCRACRSLRDWWIWQRRVKRCTSPALHKAIIHT